MHSMAEPWNHVKQKKTTYLWFYLYEMCRVGKSVEMKSGLVVALDWGLLVAKLIAMGIALLFDYGKYYKAGYGDWYIQLRQN